MTSDERARVTATMRQITAARLAGRVDDLAPIVHDEIVMFLPGFAGRNERRETFLGGFHDFCENATTLDFREGEQQVDVVGPTAVVNVAYELERRAVVGGLDTLLFSRTST